MAIFGDTLEDKVRKKLVRDAQKRKKSDAKVKSRKKNADKAMSATWKVEKASYESERSAVIQKITARKMKTWEDWNKQKRALVQGKAPQDQIDSQKTSLYAAEAKDITDIVNGFGPTISLFIAIANTCKPSFANQLSHDGQVKYIQTAADDAFAKNVKVQMELAAKLAKMKAGLQTKQFDADKISQQLSDIPLKIEDKIDEVKLILDTCLGKLVAPMYNPDLPEFDVNALIAQIKALLNPVVSATAPLQAVVGNIPVLGDLAGILGMLSSGSDGGKISNEDLKKLVPKKPELDPQLLTKLTGIGNDIMTFCMTLPMTLIQLIFAMIDVIYSKLEIITSVIPLGGMFPLSLVPAAISAGPKIATLIQVLPQMMWDLVKGIVQDKLAEAMATAFPKPNIDPGSLVALADDISEQNAAKKSVAQKKLDYSDVTKEVYSSRLSAIGYTLSQAKTIQKNYLEIYNGNGQTNMNVTGFEDNGKSQHLKSDGVTLLDAVSFGATYDDSTAEEPGFTQTTISRTAPSVDGYKAYLEALVKESDLADSLKYQKIKPVASVVGGWYDIYSDQLKEYGQDVVLKESMKPGRLAWSRIGTAAIGKL